MHKITSFEDYPLNYNTSVIDLFEETATKYPNEICLRYWNNGEYTTLTFAEVDRIATHMAWKLNDVLAGVQHVSILAEQSPAYLTYTIACLKLRKILVIISPQNSEAAIAHLLQESKSDAILTTDKFSTSVKVPATSLGVKVHTLQMDVLNLQLLKDTPVEPIVPAVSEKPDILSEKIVFYVHSSGSTAFPKLIPLTNKYIIIGAQSFVYGSANEAPELCAAVGDVLLSILPMCHMAGLVAVLGMCFFGGSNVFLPMFPPSATDVLQAFKHNNITHMTSPPLIMDMLIPVLEKNSEFELLQKAKYLTIGGANLSQQTGDYYQERGINVCNFYGTSEICICLGSEIKRSKDKLWHALKPMDAYKKYVRWEPAFEEDNPMKTLVISGDCPCLARGVINRKDGHYDTKDLFLETSPGSGLFEYHGRMDDTLVMESGEKTNPLPMEEAIRSSPIVQACTVIGEGQKCTAVLVELDHKVAFKYPPKEMIQQVQEAVREANAEAPHHSRILPQMIYILPFNQNLPRTIKGTVPRKRAIQMFQKQLGTLYKAFLEGPKSPMLSDSIDFKNMTPEQIGSLIVPEVAKTLQVDVSVVSEDLSESLFNLGLNSLLAIQLRNAVSQKFRSVPQNFVFEYPSIASMVDALLKSDINDSSNTLVEKHYEETESILETYLRRARKDFEVAKNEYDPKRPQVVMLTGATGAVGSFMLSKLLSSDKVKKVYALVRCNDPAGGRERIEKAFRNRKLDVSLIGTKMEVLPMKLEEEFLGLPKRKYDQLKEEVTMIQACGWILDFNQTVAHYDHECIRGFYNLLKFAYRPINPMHVYTVSSVSASVRMGPEVEEIPLPRDPHVAAPMGYAQSKYIVEHLLHYLSSRKRIPCFVARLGQVCGDSLHGIWNASEQYPMMIVGGGQVMNKMPDMATRIDWIPVDFAAESIVNIMLGTAVQAAGVGQQIFHIVNPNTITWRSVLDSMRTVGMQFDIVPPSDWIQELQKYTNLPAYKLMSFYENTFSTLSDFPEWKTEKTLQIAPVLGNAPVLDSNILAKCMAYWKTEGFAH